MADTGFKSHIEVLDPLPAGSRHWRESWKQMHR